MKRVEGRPRLRSQLLCMYSLPVGVAVLLTFAFILVLHVPDITARGHLRYSPEDGIILLNSTTLKKAIFNADRAWFVEFYAHWCKYSIRFAPDFKQFVTDVHDWRNILAVAAIDCAEEINSDVCNEFGIEYYPTLLFFPPHYPQFNRQGVLNTGTEIQREDENTVTSLKIHVIDQLKPHYPLLLSYTNYSDNAPHEIAARNKPTVRPVVTARSVGGRAVARLADSGHTEDAVSMNDLLHTVRFTLHTEIVIAGSIEGERLQSLQQYLDALRKFFPRSRRNTRHFLKDLYRWTLERHSVQELEFLQKLQQLEKKHSPWEGVDLHHWYDCKSTVHGRRGYSCGLWRLFHTLTVAAVEQRAAKGPLEGIHGYVKEFFGCKDCREHFNGKVARDNVLTDDMNNSPTAQALWLWRAHNEVNLRTKGTPSEDPGYPKQNYPSKEQCPECIDRKGQYVEEQVLDYLKNVYTAEPRSNEQEAAKTK